MANLVIRWNRPTDKVCATVGVVVYILSIMLPTVSRRQIKPAFLNAS